MLYLTTRDKADAFTAYKPLTTNCSPCGGLYFPFRFPVFETSYLEHLKEKSVEQCIADALNLFFPVGLSGWDVDFCIGRTTVQIQNINQRISVAEVWHNPGWNIQWMEQQLYQRLMHDKNVSGTPTEWFRIALRIGILSGVISLLLRRNDSQHPIDISVPVSDFMMPMAAYYAKQMGLPIGTVICSCNENENLWDLLNHGQMHMDMPIQAESALLNGCMPLNPERLVYAILGYPGVERYLTAKSKGVLFCLSESERRKFSDSMFAAVVSLRRIKSIILQEYRTSGYVLDPFAAMACGGVQDFRAEIGENCPALVWSEQNPIHQLGITADALGMSENELKKKINDR